MNGNAMFTGLLLLACLVAVIAACLALGRRLGSLSRRVYVHDAEYTNRDSPTPIGVGDRVWIRVLPRIFTVAQIDVDPEWSALVVDLNNDHVQIAHVRASGKKIMFWLDVSQVSSTPVAHVPEVQVITELASPAS